MIFFKNIYTGKYYKYGDYDVDSLEDATTFPNGFFGTIPTYTKMSYEKELRKQKLEKFRNK